MYCDGSDTAIRDARSCTIPITALTDSMGVFAYEGQRSVVAKFAAYNEIGWSEDSPSGNGGFIAEVPGPPTSVMADSENTSHTQVTLMWAAPANNGGSAVIEYKVSVYNDWSDPMMMDYNTWMTEEAGTTATTYTKTTEITPGGTYKFKVEAKNAIGYSVASLTVSIFAASVPETPTVPTTTHTETTIEIDWSEPEDNGSPITSYKILL